MRLHSKEQKLVDDVIENFNFNKCHRVMKHLNWGWGFPNTEVPSIEKLKKSALNRIEMAIEQLKTDVKRNPSPFYSSSSGGLCAKVYRDRYKNIRAVTLEFILTEWEEYN